MKPVTMSDVFERLVAIATAPNGGVHHATLLNCDMLHQEQLFQLQGDFASLLADVANACGPTKARVLERRFPTVFHF